MTFLQCCVLLTRQSKQCFVVADLTGETERGPGGARCQPNPSDRFRDSDSGAEGGPVSTGAGTPPTTSGAPAATAKSEGAAEARGRFKQPLTPYI